jgi:hypothetical protein
MVIRKDKRGWIRIVEAFVAILLIAGILLTIFNKGGIERNKQSDEIYAKEVAILTGIQLDDNLRRFILASPIGIESDNGIFPPPVNDYINKSKPGYLNCKAKICDVNEICLLNQEVQWDLYVRSVLISSNLKEYSPRQLNLFCTTGDEI